MGAEKPLLLSLVAVVASLALLQVQASALTANVTLISPANVTWTHLGNTEFGFTFRFDDPQNASAECTLNVNGLQYGPATALNGTETELKLTENFPEGRNEWNVSCVNGTSKTSPVRTFFADRGQPAVSVTGPLSGATLQSPVSFYFAFSDALSPQASCAVFANGTSVAEGTASNGTEKMLSASLANGDYVWHANCTDLAGNSGVSASNSFNVSTPAVLSSLTVLSPLDTIGATIVSFNMTTNAQASWCGMSLDGEENLTLTEGPTNHWSAIVYGVAEGLHNAVFHCNDSHGMISGDEAFTVLMSGLAISIQSPANTTYWKSTAASVRASTSLDCMWCRAYMDSGVPADMDAAGQKLWNYTFMGLDSGQHSLTVECESSGGLRNTTSLIFTSTTYACVSNTTGICTDTQQCVDSACLEITCPGCAYAANHTCYVHECCDDYQCPESQECHLNKCSNIDCYCGLVKNHTCVKYQCCSNFDCGNNEECDTDANICVKKKLLLLAPEYMTAGEEVTITVTSHNNVPLENVRVKVTYASGKTQTLKTDADGKVSFVPAESGGVEVTAELSGYEGDSVTGSIAASFNWVVFIMIVAGAGAAGLGYFYIMRMPPLKLIKTVSGQNVTLMVKNRGREPIPSVTIMDTVPSGAFGGAEVPPQIDDVGGVSHLVWTASLEPGEEIVIRYQASQTPKTFFARVGDDEYEGGSGLL